MNIIRKCGTLVAILVLNGCSMLPMQSEPALAERAPTDPRLTQLNAETQQLLMSIERSLVVLAETRRGAVALQSTPEEMAQREWLYRVTPPGMGVPITIHDWRGHPKSVIQMIADLTGYHVETIGTPKPTTRNVSVSAISRPAVEILRSVAAQMGCDGLVDPQGANRKIVVDWSYRDRGGCE